MNSNTEKTLDDQSIHQENTDSKNETAKPSATTSDIPEFGWSSYAERINGRFAMIGLTAVILIEAVNKMSFLEWAGFISR
tara:strand:+ start:129 stop:368 length:240 start_codon:yes stop_codon:yes gene_type:complete